MIEVETTTALLLYLGLFLTICFGAWIFTHFKSCKKQAVPPFFLLLRCEYCHFNYLGKNGEKITQCPQCRSFNKNVSKQT
jgi:hypothetical protein